MKKLLIILVLMLFSFSSSDFEQGWEDGFCSGWKDVRGQFTVCPVTPVAPVPKVGMDNYKGGFVEGFKRGTRDASR